jgi:hypothetical protein
VLYLDEESFERATGEGDEFRRAQGKSRQVVAGVLELTLRPYAVARIDCDSALPREAGEDCILHTGRVLTWR